MYDDYLKTQEEIESILLPESTLSSMDSGLSQDTYSTSNLSSTSNISMQSVSILKSMYLFLLYCEAI